MVTKQKEIFEICHIQNDPSFFKPEDTLADVDPKKTRVLWKHLFGKNKALKSIALERRKILPYNSAEQQEEAAELQLETSAFYKSSRKAKAEEAAEALQRQQEAEQEKELQKRV